MVSMKERISSWLVFMKFGADLTAATVRNKLAGTFKGAETAASVILDDGMPGVLLDYFVGGFQIPVFVVIDPATKKAVSITGNNDYCGFNPRQAFEDAKAAVDRLLNAP